MIPRLIHQMFIPPAEDPHRTLDAEVLAQCAAWQAHHPEFEYRLWNLAAFRGLCIVHDALHVFEAIQACRFPSMKVDMARLTILSALGGFWADLKLVPLRPFLSDLIGHRLVLAEHFVNDAWVPGLPCAAFMGAEPGHAFLHAATEHALRQIEARWPRTLEVAGPNALYHVLSAMRHSGQIGPDYVMLPQHVAWNGLFANGSSSYNRGRTGDMHWSLRERVESPYLDAGAPAPATRTSATPTPAHEEAAMPVSSDAFNDLVSHVLARLRPGRVCDIGSGAGKYGKLVRSLSSQLDFPVHCTAIEIDAQYVEQFALRQLYDEVVAGDALDLLKTPRARFDVVIIGDCIEHMRKSHAIDLLNFLVYRAGYILVLWPDEAIQDDWEGHAAEAHISTWSVDDFRPWNVLHASRYVETGRMNIVLLRGYQRTSAVISGQEFRQWQDAPFIPAQAADTRSALDRLRDRVRDDPGNVTLCNQLAYALMETGRVQEAREALLAAVRRNGAVGSLLLTLSHACNRLSLPQEAILYGHAAVSALPGEFHAHMHLAYLLFGVRELDDARTTLLAAAALNPNDPRPFEMLSTLHERAGRPTEALEAIEVALRLSPDNPLFRQRREQLLAGAGP